MGSTFGCSSFFVCVLTTGSSFESDSIKLVLNDINDEKIFDYFKNEGIETKYISYGAFIELNQLAINTLQLYNADIVELIIDEEMIVITRI